jgi:hypothetical protein
MRLRVRTIARVSVVVSALLCLATFLFWAQSYWWCDQIDSMDRGWQAARQPYVWFRSVQLKSSRGEISLAIHFDSKSDPATWDVIRLGDQYQPRFSLNSGAAVVEPPIIADKSRHLGFGLKRDNVSTLVMLPHAAFAVPTLICFLVTVYFMRRVKYPPGCCKHCGYDLRAARKRCPECGRRAPRRRFAGDRFEPWMAFVRKIPRGL